MPANTYKILKTGMSHFKTSYMEQRPHQFRALKPKDTRKQLQQFKCVKILKTGMSHFKTSYMEQRPHQFRALKPKDTRKQLQQFKCVIPSS